jgi:molecular chaperone GrpE
MMSKKKTMDATKTGPAEMNEIGENAAELNGTENSASADGQSATASEVEMATEIPVEIRDEEPRHESEAKKPEVDLAQKYLEQLQWQQAEFQNYKKRVEREKNEIARYVKGDLIRKLLPVIDDLNRSLKNQEEKKDFEGFRLINEKLLLLLKEEGLEEVSAAGSVFDPNYHDALYTQEVDDAESDGKVLEEWERGYFFQGTLLRASKVKVGKKKD